MLAVTAACIGLAGIGYLLYDLPLSPTLESPPARSFALQTRAGQHFAFRGVYKAKGESTPYEALPADLVNAVLAIEDRRFFSHGGIDGRGLLRAAWINLRAGSVQQGGSTLTQQYVKLTYLSPERTLRRKIQEALLAVWLENRLDKKEIFQRYINTVYFGAGAYGIGAAARRYFDKRVEDLTLAESAMLAGLTRAPSRWAPTDDLEAARDRAGVVLRSMVDAGLLTEARAAEALANPAELAQPASNAASTGYFADWVTSRAEDLLGPVYGHFTLRTTLDPDLQDAAESVVVDHLDRKGERLAVDQAALVALAPDGAVRAMVGGRDYLTSQFNRATQARRQPGSLFKLFVYLSALRAGLSPDSRVVDRPVEVEGWRPENYNDRYLGPVTLRQAFAESINAVAVQLTEEVGRNTVADTARDLGIASPLKPHPSLALGTSSVNLLEMVAAYGAVQAGVPRLNPYGIVSLSTTDSQLYRHAAPIRSALDPAERQARREMMDLLRAAVQSGTGRAADPGEPFAGKTGTSQDYRDAWFVGMTDELVVGVWVGNDNNQPMNEVTGGRLPARIWRDFVVRAHERNHERVVASAPAVSAEPEPDVGTKPEPDIETVPEPKVETEAESDVKTEPGPDIEAEPEPDVEAPPDPGIEAEPAPDPPLQDTVPQRSPSRDTIEPGTSRAGTGKPKIATDQPEEEQLDTAKTETPTRKAKSNELRGEVNNSATNRTTQSRDTVVRGRPEVLDVATLRFGNRIVHLAGVRPVGMNFVAELQSYIGDRVVTCRVFDPRTHRCEVGGFDLSEVVIFNGGARPTRAAPDYLHEAEAHARASRIGIWR